MGYTTRIITKFFILLSLQVILNSCGSEPFPIVDNGKTNFYPSITNFQNEFYTTKAFRTSSNSPYQFPVTILQENSYLVLTTSNELIKIKDEKQEWLVNLNQLDSTKESIIANKPVSDGHFILLSTINGDNYCLNTNGKLLWEKSIEQKNISSLPLEPLILNNSIILGNTEGKVVSLDSVGKVKWEFTTNGVIYRTIVADKGNRIYLNSQNRGGKNKIGNDTLFVLGQDGKLVKSISFEGENILRNPVVTEKYLYFATSVYQNTFEKTNIYMFDLEFNLQSKVETNYLPRHLSVNSQKDELIVVGYNSGFQDNLNNGIFCYSKKGEEKWHIYYEYSISHPILISQQSLCFTASNGQTIGLFYLNADTGQNIKIISLGSLPDFNLTPTVIQDGSLLYSSKVTNQFVLIDGTPLDRMIKYKFH